MVIVGIDPGVHGSLAGLDTEQKVLWAIEMPTVETDSKTKKLKYDIARIAALLRACKPDLICLEAVHSMPRDGKASAFKFGMGFGILLGIIGTLNISLLLVTPQSWKKSYCLSSNKEESRELASELFPSCTTSKFWHTKSREGVAEAALIARWGAKQGAPQIDTATFLPSNVWQLYQIPNIHDR